MPRELGHELIPLEAVQETILSHVEPVGTESRRLTEAVGAVLREVVVAREEIPPFDNSGMDGFAVRVGDLDGASEDRPVTLEVEAVLAAGRASRRPLAPGKTIRIMTGAPVPAGAEAIVPHELTRHDERRVTFSAPARPGQHIRRAGEDFRPGVVGLAAGRVVRAHHLGIAGTLGWGRVTVSRALRVAIVSPGDELVDVDAPCGPGQIRNSNACSLRGALADLGAEVMDRGIIPDRKETVREAIFSAVDHGADAIVSTGGVSAGDFDYIRAVVEEDAEPGYVFKVAMRPGKPQVFGLFSGKPLFGMPGNPAASVLSFEMLVRPALRKMRGENTIHEPRFRVRFPFDYSYKPGRVFLLRTRVVPDDESPSGGFRVDAPGAQGSGLLAALADSNAIVILPGDRDRVHAGEAFPAQWIGGRP